MALRIPVAMGIAAVFYVSAYHSAMANGRPPQALDIRFGSGGAPILAATSFGMLLSKDSGATFRWVCEQSIGITGDFDPEFLTYADGRIFSSTPTNGVTVSSDGACSFTPVGGVVENHNISALRLAADAKTVLASSASLGKRNAVFVAEDGATFRETAIASDTLVFDTVAGAPSDAKRIYAGALSMRYENPVLYVSKDGGATAETHDVGQPLGHQIKILGVDKANADRLFILVRVGAMSALSRSEDGGVTFTEIFRGSVLGLGAGYDPTSGVLYVSTTDKFLRSTDHGATFTAAPMNPRTRCLAFDASSHVFACLVNNSGSLMVRSMDQGNSFASYIELSQAALPGALACPLGTATKTECEPRWPGIADQLGIGQPLPADAGAGGAPADASGPLPDAGRSDAARTSDAQLRADAKAGGGSGKPKEGCAFLHGSSLGSPLLAALMLFGIRRRRVKSAGDIPPCSHPCHRS